MTVTRRVSTSYRSVMVVDPPMFLGDLLPELLNDLMPEPTLGLADTLLPISPSPTITAIAFPPPPPTQPRSPHSAEPRRNVLARGFAVAAFLLFAVALLVPTVPASDVIPIVEIPPVAIVPSLPVAKPAALAKRKPATSRKPIKKTRAVTRVKWDPNVLFLGKS